MQNKVLFITQPFVIEPLGIGALSATIKKAGYDVDLLQADGNYTSIINRVKESDPAFLCYSLWTGGHKYLNSLNIAIRKSYRLDTKKKDVVSIFGGPHCTFTNNGISMDYVDHVIKGEADILLPEILNKITSGEKVDKQIYNSMPVQSLDTLPFVDRDLMYKYKRNSDNPIRSISTSRGCPYSCPYCYNEKFKDMFEGQKLRFRSIQNVIAEAVEIKNNYPSTRYFFFQDDELGCQLSRLKTLASLWPSMVGLPFHAQMRVEYIKDVKIGLLKKAGCNSITFAVEAGSEETRRNVLNKRFTNDQIVEAVNILKKHGMKFRIENMIGIPFVGDGDIEKDMWNTYKLNMKLKPDIAWVSLFQPYPGTSLGNKCIKSGLWDGNTDAIPEAFFEKSILNFNIKTKNRLNGMQRTFSLLVKYPVLRHLSPILFRLNKKILNWIYIKHKNFLYKRLYGF